MVNLAPDTTDKGRSVVDMVTNICFSIKFGVFLEYHRYCWPLKNIMRYFRFQIQMTVQFRLGYCGS